MIRVLHVVSALGSGGVESMLYNYYSHINKDEISFDFIVHDREEGMLEGQFMKYGSKIYHVTPKKDNPIKNFLEIYKIIKGGKYDIVHCHQNFSSFIPLVIAKINNVSIRIAHAHTAFNCLDSNDNSINKIMRFIIKNTATQFCACTYDSAKFLYGEKFCKRKDIVIINNAIDLKKFIYKKQFREEIIKELDIDGQVVIGNVGRLCKEKNHEFLIDVFGEIQEKIPNSVLLIVGKGEEEIALKTKISKIPWKEKIILLGERLDVNKIMCAMDIFILPSLFEGLGVVLIEAQAVGVKCIASEGVIPKETNITDLINYVKLDEGKSKWSEIIVEKIHTSIGDNSISKIKQNGYDIESATSKLVSFYKSECLKYEKGTK